MVLCVDAVAVSLFLFSCWCCSHCTCSVMCLLYQCWLCVMLMFWCDLWCCCHVVIVISATVIIIMMIMAHVPVVLFRLWIWKTRVELLQWSWRVSLWWCSDHGCGRPGFNCYDIHGVCPCDVFQIVDLEDGILQLKEDLIQERTEARQEKKRLKRAVVSICSLSSLWLWMWCSVKESL